MLALLLPILERVWGAIWALLARIPGWGWLVLVLALWGWHWQHTADHAEAVVTSQAAALAKAQTDIKSSEAARKHEQQLTVKVQEISDELQTTQAARDATARSSAERLRDLANAKRSNAALAASLTACRSYAGAPVDVVPGQARAALVDLAHDADAVSDQLRACQAYIKNVVQPTLPAQR